MTIEPKNETDPKHANETLLHTSQEIKEKLAHAQSSVVSYIKKNPIKVMGISLLAGIVVAKIMRWRK